MAGSFTFHPYPLPLTGSDLSGFAVYRYTPGSAFEAQLLPNVVCLSTSEREGPDVPTARFRYITSDVADPSFPKRFEDVFPLESNGPYTVGPDDRLIVAQFLPLNRVRIAFDGFAKLPEAQYGPRAELVPFQCAGTPEREFDAPIGGAVYRDADDPSALVDVVTSLPVRFNPDGMANATPADMDTVSPRNPNMTYPVFIDPLVVKQDPAKGRKWTLGMAVRYLIGTGNPSEDYVRNRNFLGIDFMCQAIVPAPGHAFVNPADLSSFELADIICQDYEATGKSWPEAVCDLIRPHGMRLVWFLTTTQAARPEWQAFIMRDDDDKPAKPLLLQRSGEVLDPGRSNVGSAQLARDMTSLVNRIDVDTAPRQVEASFVLAPLFPISATDADAANLKKWKRGNPEYDPTKYRDYGFDECGEGHWDFGFGSLSDTPGDLSPVFQDGDDRTFAKRRRPPLQTLIAKDMSGKPFRAELWFCKAADYDGPVPGVWDGDVSVKWQQATGNWQVLKDRLGIRITDDDLTSWGFATGNQPADAIVTSPKLNVILSQTNTGAVTFVGGVPTNANPLVYFRLTCVIEDDQGLASIAFRRDASPTRFEVARRVDTRDRFVRQTVSRFSHIAAAAGKTADFDFRDDTEEATRYAEAMRRSGESARFGGAIEIPRATWAYHVGDKITSIDGRDVTLRTNAGTSQGEADRYPIVVGIDRELGDRQSTTIHLSDRRAEPESYRVVVSGSPDSAV